MRPDSCQLFLHLNPKQNMFQPGTWDCTHGYLLLKHHSVIAIASICLLCAGVSVCVCG